MEYFERIQRSIDFIELHLNESLLVEEIAKRAYLSIPHLYRIFPFMTGCTVGQYIRKRRLSTSVYELLNTNKRVIDIAFDFQFESQESYIRAFKAMFGITPSEYRRSKGIIATYNRIFLNNRQKKGDFVMQPIIVKKKFLFVGLVAEINLRSDFGETLNYLRQSLIQNLDNINMKKDPNRMVGIWLPYEDYGDEEYDSKRNYFAGVEVACIDDVPGNLVVKDLPESLYAVFKEKSRGTISRYMYTEWLPASGYILNEDLLCDLEIFNDMKSYEVNDECDILLPVRAHQNE